MPRRPRRAVLALGLVAALVAATAAYARPDASAKPLGQRLAAALDKAGARTGALVVDLATGKPVFAENPATPLVPASNEKLAVAYAALVALGPAYRIPTEVRGVGRRAGAVWRGNLVLKGYGDPMLSSRGVEALARRVRKLGIKRISGAVVGDESYFDSERTSPGWKASFYLHESAPLSGLIVDHGRYDGHIARIPALAAAGVFRRALRAAGVSVGGPAVAAHAGGKVLAYRMSPPLALIVRFMDTHSDNLTAELLLKELGGALLGRGTTAAGARAVRKVLADAGVPLAGVRIVDGSGLSSLDRLTPRALAAILERAWRDERLREVFVGSLAAPGRIGTLKHRLLRGPARARVRAKTGTTSVASALSGYVGDRYAFVILQNGRPVPWWSTHEAQDRFVELLAAQ